MTHTDFDYRGSRGTTRSCVEAIATALAESRSPGSAVLVSGPADKYGCRSHLFVLTSEEGTRTVTRDGFASGYGGTGPAGLTQAILLLDAWKWELEEVRVDGRVFERIATGRMTVRDEEIVFEGGRRYPISEIFYRYVPMEELENAESRNSWRGLPVILPIPLFDRRLHDLVQSFWTDPDAALSRGYRRLEELIRARTGMDDHGAKLFSRAFLHDKAPLTWDEHEGEARAYAQLFAATFSAFRNARAHRELESSENELAMELLQLNTLFILESRAIERESGMAGA